MEELGVLEDKLDETESKMTSANSSLLEVEKKKDEVER